MLLQVLRDRFFRSHDLPGTFEQKKIDVNGTYRRFYEVYVFDPTGSIDKENAFELQRKFEESIRLSRHIVFNFENASIVNSEDVLKYLVAASKEAQRIRGSFRICNLPEDFELELENHPERLKLDIFSDEMSAIFSFR